MSRWGWVFPGNSNLRAEVCRTGVGTSRPQGPVRPQHQAGDMSNPVKLLGVPQSPQGSRACCLLVLQMCLVVSGHLLCVFY